MSFFLWPFCHVWNWCLEFMFINYVVGTCAIEHTHARTQRAQPLVSLRWAGQLVWSCSRFNSDRGHLINTFASLKSVQVVFALTFASHSSFRVGVRDCQPLCSDKACVLEHRLLLASGVLSIADRIILDLALCAITNFNWIRFLDLALEVNG